MLLLVSRLLQWKSLDTDESSKARKIKENLDAVEERLFEAYPQRPNQLSTSYLSFTLGGLAMSELFATHRFFVQSYKLIYNCTTAISHWDMFYLLAFRIVKTFAIFYETWRNEPDKQPVPKSFEVCFRASLFSSWLWYWPTFIGWGDAPSLWVYFDWIPMRNHFVLVVTEALAFYCLCLVLPRHPRSKMVVDAMQTKIDRQISELEFAIFIAYVVSAWNRHIMNPYQLYFNVVDCRVPPHLGIAFFVDVLIKALTFLFLRATIPFFQQPFLSTTARAVPRSIVQRYS